MEWGSKEGREGARDVLLEGDRKFFQKTATCGPFRTGGHGNSFPDAEQVAEGFPRMKAPGVHGLRSYTPLWLMGLAMSEDIRGMVGIPWEQHVTFLDSPGVKVQIRPPCAPLWSSAAHPARP